MFDLRRSDVSLLQAVADHGSLHAAERDSRMTQSTASRRLVRLERRVRTALVSRSSTGTELTEEGHALLHAGRRLLGAIDFALATAHQGAGTAARLPVVPFAVAAEWASGHAHDLAGTFPDVVFDVVATGSAEGWRRLARCAVDAACCWDRDKVPAASTDTRLLTVLEEPQWLALPAAHPLAHHDAVDLHHLTDAEWVVIHDENFVATEAGRAIAGSGPAPRIGCAVQSAGAALDLVGRGYGVALVSPVCPARRPAGAVALRPLRQQLTRRLLLGVDPLMVPESLAERLRDWLRRHYVQVAARRNRAYLSCRAFPVVHAPAAPARPPAVAASPPGGPLPTLLSELPGAEPGAPTPLEAEHLHLLRMIERAGSLNQAASALLVTQPALTRRIHRLEKLCGLALVHSAPRGTSLSSVARRILSCTGPAEVRLDTLVARLRGPAGTPPARPAVSVRDRAGQPAAACPATPRRRVSASVVSATER